MSIQEPTEREQKLIGYILALIGALNVVMIFVASMYKNQIWMEGEISRSNLKATEDEMIDYLKSEFGIPMSVVLDKDFIASTEEKHD